MKLTACLIALLWPAVALAQSAPTTAPSTQPKVLITVAIFDFEAKLPGNPDMGKQTADALTAMLSGSADLQLVDRAQMSKTLTEHELNLTGLVDPDKAVKVGHLIGAKILVTGKVFALDKTMFATAKIIGTETSRVEGVLVRTRPERGLLVISIDILQRSVALELHCTDVAPL